MHDHSKLYRYSSCYKVVISKTENTKKGEEKINFPRDSKITSDHIQSRLDWGGFQCCEGCGQWGFESVVDACHRNVTAKKTHSILKSMSDAGFKMMHSEARGSCVSCVWQEKTRALVVTIFFFVLVKIKYQVIGVTFDIRSIENITLCWLGGNVILWMNRGS